MQYKYEKRTESLEIKIDTNSGEKVARVTSGITFLPMRGESEAFAVASNTVVQSSTSITFTLMPEHAVYVQDGVSIMVTFPQDVRFVTSCTVKPSTATCFKDPLDGQIITVANLLT